MHVDKQKMENIRNIDGAIGAMNIISDLTF